MHLQEAALVFYASSKKHEEIQSTKKEMSVISKGNTDHPSTPYATNNLFRK